MAIPDVVVDYDSAWPPLFEDLRDRIMPSLDGLTAVVEHIGSTSVPGLAAKPIVDIDIVVRRHADIAEVVIRLVALGYGHEGDRGIAGREAFAPPSDWNYHHLYLVVEGSRAHRDHVDLRDYLRSHPDAVKRYAERKRTAAAMLRHDREAYVAAKSDVVEDLLSLARRAPRGSE